MTTDTMKPWIVAGYSLFAKEGPTGLKIEVLSRIVNKSKSSFYHHFADTEVFTEFLLNYHLSRATYIAEREKACERIDPDLINVLIDVKLDLLFNKQLRINRANQTFKRCLDLSNQLVGNAFLETWTKDLGLGSQYALADNFLGLVLENFYLQLTEETLTYNWLSAYVNSIKTMVAEFKKA